MKDNHKRLSPMECIIYIASNTVCTELQLKKSLIHCTRECFGAVGIQIVFFIATVKLLLDEHSENLNFKVKAPTVRSTTAVSA